MEFNHLDTQPGINQLTPSETPEEREREMREVRTDEQATV